MTSKEAITYLNVIWNRYKAEYEIERETLDAYHMAIEALSATNLKEEFESAEYEDYEHATLVDIKEPLKVLVVRCKDCRHYEDGMVGYCWEVDRGVSGDFFCAYGERREE